LGRGNEGPSAFYGPSSAPYPCRRIDDPRTLPRRLVRHSKRRSNVFDRVKRVFRARLDHCCCFWRRASCHVGSNSSIGGTGWVVEQESASRPRPSRCPFERARHFTDRMGGSIPRRLRGGTAKPPALGAKGPRGCDNAQQDGPCDAEALDASEPIGYRLPSERATARARVFRRDPKGHPTAALICLILAETDRLYRPDESARVLQGSRRRGRRSRGRVIRARRGSRRIAWALPFGKRRIHAPSVLRPQAARG